MGGDCCKGDGEYDASDEKGMGPTSPFPQPGDFHFLKKSSFTILPRFEPGTQGWRLSFVEMLFMLMEGDLSGKARCSLFYLSFQKSFDKSCFACVSGRRGAK